MNSNRNPKSLRDFIEKSKLDGDEPEKMEFEEALKNLKNLSQEEKSEIGLLKSRVDEQSRLIMILKQRSDEFIRKNMTLEKLNQELIEKKDELEIECKSANEKYNFLKDKFDYLANNHEELIKIKDEYKLKNVELNFKYDILVEKMKHLPSEEIFRQEKEALIKENSILNEKLENLNKTCNDYQNKYLVSKGESENFLAKIKQEISNCQLKENEIANLNIQIQDFKKQNKELVESLEKLKEESSKINEKNLHRINELNKQNEELYLMCENLKKEKKIIFDNQMNLEKNYKNICQELNKFKETYSKDGLHNELQEANRKYSDLEKQFDAYKSYTNSIIEKERELNNKLRFMIS